MTIPVFIWLIWLPLLAAPLIYLIGRLLPRQAAQWTAFLALSVTWLPFVLTWQAYARQEMLSFTLGQITLRMDGVALLLTAVVLTLATLVTLYSGADMAGTLGEEKYYAMVVAMSGTMIGLGCAADLFNLWLWFEAMAVTSYLLVAFYREQPASLEAGAKYLVQSVIGSVLVLFGVALVLAQTGTLNLIEMRAVIENGQSQGFPLLAAGGLFIVGFGVKIAFVPLHTWLPDAHAQAPSGISALLSGVVIEAGLLALLRALAGLAGVTFSWGVLLLTFGALNMLAGNLLALPQKQVKRLLAFSSISHVGYMLLGAGIAVYAGETAAAEGAFFHLINHSLMKGLAFLAAGAFLYALRPTAESHQPLIISELSGAAWRYPLLATVLVLALLSLGGIPPLAGFMSKWQILAAGMATQQLAIIALVAFAAFNSLLSLTYYLPLTRTLFQQQLSAEVKAGRPLPVTMTFPLVILAVAIIAIGLWPNMLASLTTAAGAVIGGQ
jgi:proton-translocating NADH-quinone oxidoreductase chain N